MLKIMQLVCGRALCNCLVHWRALLYCKVQCPPTSVSWLLLIDLHIQEEPKPGLNVSLGLVSFKLINSFQGLKLTMYLSDLLNCSLSSI